MLKLCWRAGLNQALGARPAPSKAARTAAIRRRSSSSSSVPWWMASPFRPAAAISCPSSAIAAASGAARASRSALRANVARTPRAFIARMMRKTPTRLP